jgi:hypothetical protein
MMRNITVQTIDTALFLFSDWFLHLMDIDPLVMDLSGLEYKIASN